MSGSDVPPDRAIEEERRLRDAQAGAYDERLTRLSWELEVLDACVRRVLELRPGDRVVDAGCGTGRHIPWLLEGAGSVVGIDHSPRSLDVARGRLEPDQLGRVELIAGDVRDLPLGDRVAERLLSAQVIQHVPTHEFRLQAAREFLRVLEPGGIAVLVVYKWLGHTGLRRDGFFEGEGGRVPYHGFTSRELRRLLSDAGFVDIIVGGAPLLPWLGKRLGMSAEAQARPAFAPLVRHLGEYLVARAVRPARK